MYHSCGLHMQYLDLLVHINMSLPYKTLNSEKLILQK